MSGIFFTWTNAVKPGIGTLNNISYLRAFKAMNKAILNPLFYIVFILPVLTITISAYINYGSPNFYVFKLLVNLLCYMPIKCQKIFILTNQLFIH